MSIPPIEQVKQLLIICSADERQELLRTLRDEFPIHKLERSWNAPAEVICEAIDRASDLTQRMFRGVLSEAACKVEVINKLEGWKDITEPGKPYDFKVSDGKRDVTIQAKLERSQEGQPMRAVCSGLSDRTQFVVETQKTRAGKDASGADTRPYRFGEFDILAVSMKPSTGSWADFRFTLGRWLIPRADKSLIAVYRPVAPSPNDDWTDSLPMAIEWFPDAPDRRRDALPRHSDRHRIG